MQAMLDPYLQWTSAWPGPLTPGSPEHRDAFCRMLLETFNPYRPAVIDWPTLSALELERMRFLPFWDTAVAIEGRAALRMDWQAEHINDMLISDGLKLNAAEERRHKKVLRYMLASYGIATGPEPVYRRPRDPELGFLCTGYGECINSFFAFGLFDLAKRSGFFPMALVETFEPIIQEEARHILFFANYLAYRRATLGWIRYVLFQVKCGVAILEQVFTRIEMAIAARRRTTARSIRANFLTKGAGATAGRLDQRAFLVLCLSENDRRMAGYDRRLVRPLLIPRLVQVALGFSNGVLTRNR